MAPSHPLSILSIEETNLAREIVLAHHDQEVVDFREIFLQEPAKAELVKYLELEHSGRLSPSSPRPPRLAKCQYDVIGLDRIPAYHESVVDIGCKKRTKHEVIGKQHQAALTL
jgi:primary-amine oxidase